MNASKIAAFTFLLIAAVTPAGTGEQAAPGIHGGDSAATTLPKDVYPDSRNRLPLPKRDDVDDYGKQVFDKLPAGQRLPASVHSVRLYSPVARPLEEAAQYLNFETGLPERLVEIAILTTAREMECQFEWTQNEPRGRNPGDPRHLEPTVIDAIKYRKTLSGIGERDAAVITLGREMFGERRCRRLPSRGFWGIWGARGRSIWWNY
jgi:4-carboxymuconolactone decarboxylase